MCTDTQRLRCLVLRTVGMHGIQQNVGIDAVHRLNRYSFSPANPRGRPSCCQGKTLEDCRQPRCRGVPNDAASRRWLPGRSRSPGGPCAARSDATVPTAVQGKEFVASSWFHVQHGVSWWSSGTLPIPAAGSGCGYRALLQRMVAKTLQSVQVSCNMVLTPGSACRARSCAVSRCARDNTGYLLDIPRSARWRDRVPLGLGTFFAFICLGAFKVLG